MPPDAATQWAQEEYGHAQLGDTRSTRRLQHTAAQAARQPHGTITGTLRNNADQQGAYHLLNNPRFTHQHLQHATHHATARRCHTPETIIIAVDGSSLTLTDRTKRKPFGPISPHETSRGIKTLTALAITEHGTPLGILAQHLWVRPPEPQPEPHQRRHTHDKETQRWLDTLIDAHQHLQDAHVYTTAWYQLDREADAWPILQHAAHHQLQLTVRAAHDRRVLLNPTLHSSGGISGQRGRLFSVLETQPCLGMMEVRIPARSGRVARTALLEVRAKRVLLDITAKPAWSKVRVWMWAVEAREVSDAPPGQALLWRLLSTVEARSFERAVRVVRAYTLRWRVEDFHRAWKGGVCGVERTQLRSFEGVAKWAVIMGSVAVRALRLAHLAREAPDVLAEVEFSAVELRAVEALCRARAGRVPALRTVGEVVRAVALLGGFVPSREAPPGASVVARGLRDVAVVALAFGALPDDHL